jgi:perosamine synthetase
MTHRWEYGHDEVGYNYRMPNINAALGCAQLEQLPGFLADKRRLFERYAKAFAGMREANLMAEPAGCRSNYWLQTLLLNPAVAGQRDAILAATNDAGLMTRPAWTLMHKLAPFRDAPRMPLGVAESLEARLINIPSSVFLAARTGS